MFGLKFRRQHPVGNYILDFYCAELKLCIEVVRVRNEDVFRQPTATWDFLVGAVVRVLCEKTGRSEMDVLRELHDPAGPLSPLRWGEGTTRWRR